MPPKRRSKRFPRRKSPKCKSPKCKSNCKRYSPKKSRTPRYRASAEIGHSKYLELQSRLIDWETKSRGKDVQDIATITITSNGTTTGPFNIQWKDSRLYHVVQDKTPHRIFETEIRKEGNYHFITSPMMARILLGKLATEKLGFMREATDTDTEFIELKKITNESIAKLLE